METEQSTLVTLATKLLGMRRGCVRTLDCGLTVSHTARKKVNPHVSTDQSVMRNVMHIGIGVILFVRCNVKSYLVMRW